MLGVLDAHSFQSVLVQSDQRPPGDLMLQKVLAVEIEILVTVTLQPFHDVMVVPKED